MPTAVDKKRRYKTITKTCYIANIFYTLLYLFYLTLFLVAKLDVMIYITIGFVGVYLLFFLVIKFKKYYLYALLCGNFFFAYIILSTLMLGFHTGFYFYLIAFIVVTFFVSYFKAKNVKGSLIWVALSVAIYLALYFVTRFVDSYYLVEEWMEVSLFTTHSIVAFVIMTLFLVIFLRYAFGLEKKIMNESRTDELTQINNRYALYDYFDQEDKTNKVLALFDIDDFKLINDKYGHVSGDYVLKKVAEITSNTLNDSFVCRYGGEEFVIVLNDDENNKPYDQLEKLRITLENEIFEFEGVKIKITITIGLAKYEDGLKLERWIFLADEKMYQGKKTGKNKVVG